jgi:hypothetical protein
MAEASALLQNVKNYLDITWVDANTDSKLLGIIERGIRYLDKLSGSTLDYSIEDTPKALLLDYCRYARSNALEQFQNNYMHELLSLQINEEVARYEAENPVATV